MDEISNKTKPKDIQDALEKPPQGLNDTYNRTINRIKSQGSESWNLARKVLLWLSNALKPLSLEELQEAVAVETAMTSISKRDLDDTECLISVCAGLAVLEGEKETAAPRLVHYTLQEYLNQNQDILSPDPHAEVARACLAFLSFDNFGNKLREGRIGIYSYKIPHNKAPPNNPYHLTFYAALAWGHHAQRAGETEEVMAAAVDFVSRPANVAYNWLVFMNAEYWTGPWDKRYTQIMYEDLLKDADLFRLLLPVQFGLEGILVELLKRYTRPAENTLDTVISRLACHAARCGYKEIVRLLLTEKDVDWDICDMSGQPLLLLVDEDNLRTLLHKENCSVNTTSDYGSALHVAVMDTDPSRVQLLFEAGADVGGIDKYGNPVIRRAIDNGILSESWGEMMDLLLEYKADINAHNPDGSTALHLAARTPLYGSSVKYLVSRGANLNLPNGEGKTPLDRIEESATKGDDLKGYKGDYDHEMVIQIVRKAGGKPAKEMSQHSIDEKGPSFPPEWLDRVRCIQEMYLSYYPEDY